MTIIINDVGHARIVVMLHPEDQENAAEQKVAAITGIESLGGGAKVSSPFALPPPPPPPFLLPFLHPAVNPDTCLNCNQPPNT